MKRHVLILAGLSGLAIVAIAGQRGTALDSFNQTLNGAKGLDVKYTLTDVGGPTNEYTVSFAKPNKARIDTPTMLVVADGDTITKYMKADGVFYKVDQTKEKLAEIMKMDSLRMWAPFFDAEAANMYNNAKDAAPKRNLKVVTANADEKGTTKVTFYIDPATYLAKQAEIVSGSNGRNTTTIFNATKAQVTEVSDDMFAFKAPAGAKEIQEVDLVAGKWLHNFGEALEAATISDKLVFVDFMASWCGPCKMMDAEVFQTSAFKELTKDMVLVKVDVDVDTATAAKYGITAMPTCKFVNSKGEVVHEFVGYGGFAQVMGEVKKAKSKFGK